MLRSHSIPKLEVDSQPPHFSQACMQLVVPTVLMVHVTMDPSSLDLEKLSPFHADKLVARDWRAAKSASSALVSNLFERSLQPRASGVIVTSLT